METFIISIKSYQIINSDHLKNIQNILVKIQPHKPALKQRGYLFV